MILDCPSLDPDESNYYLDKAGTGLSHRSQEFPKTPMTHEFLWDAPSRKSFGLSSAGNGIYDHGEATLHFTDSFRFELQLVKLSHVSFLNLKPIII